MENKHKNICVFMHFSNDLQVPQYVRIYLQELAQHFERIIFVANHVPKRVISFDANLPVEVLQVKNEGYDLGMFYKAFQTIHLKEYDQIACVNDSNVLINKLEPVFNWSRNNVFDFWGLVDSNERPWFSSHSENYHIQSHFIVFNNRAIQELPEFFKAIDFEEIYREENLAKVRKTVINNWEIGLSQYLISKGLTYGSYVDSRVFSDEFYSGKAVNVTHKLYAELIESGYPLIKKKIIAEKKWTDSLRNVQTWENMIRKYGNKNWEIDALIEEMKRIRENTASPTLLKIRKMLLDKFSPSARKKIA